MFLLFVPPPSSSLHKINQDGRMGGEGGGGDILISLDDILTFWMKTKSCSHVFVITWPLTYQPTSQVLHSPDLHHLPSLPVLLYSIPAADKMELFSSIVTHENAVIHLEGFRMADWEERGNGDTVEICYKVLLARWMGKNMLHKDKTGSSFKFEAEAPL